MLLDKFYMYTQEYPVGGGSKEVFSQDTNNRTLMTLHALVLLLMFDKFTFGPGEFDKLRRYLKMQAPHLVKLFRCAHPSGLSRRHLLWCAAFTICIEAYGCVPCSGCCCYIACFVAAA